jgi:hypothetical protein
MVPGAKSDLLVVTGGGARLEFSPAAVYTAGQTKTLLMLKLRPPDLSDCDQFTAKAHVHTRIFPAAKINLMKRCSCFPVVDP